MAPASPPTSQNLEPSPSPAPAGRRRSRSGAAAQERATSSSPAPAPDLLLPAPSPPRFVSKWVSLSAGLIVSLCSGLTYLFSLYAPALRAEFGWTQTQVRGEGERRAASVLCIPSMLRPRDDARAARARARAVR